MPTAAQVKALSPTGEFAAYTDAFVDDLITNEVAGHYGSVSEPPLDRLIALHTAHLLAVMNMSGGGGVGPVGGLVGVSISVGGASKQYAQPQAQVPGQNWGDLDDRTGYGRRALALRASVPTMRAART